MGIGFYNSLVTLQAAGPAVTGTAAATLLNSQAKWACPGQFFESLGQKLYLRAQGMLSNIVTTPGTLTFNLLYGATAVWTSAAINMPNTAQTSLPFWLEVDLTTRIQGNVAQFMGQGRVTSLNMQIATGAIAATPNTLMLPATTPALGTAFDNTAAALVDFQATFSITGNSITLQQYELISCNWGG